MMKRPFFYIFICTIALSLIPSVSFAQKGWVSDMLVLTFREGPGNAYNVLKTITSNTPVTILEEQNGFYKVELKSSEVGWVDKRFIIFETPNAILIDQYKRDQKVLEDKIEKLESQLKSGKDLLTAKDNEYSGKLTPLQDQLNTAREENKTLKEKLAQSRKKYDTLIEQSKNIQSIVAEKNALKEQNDTFSAELSSIKSKNKNMFRTAMIKWFLAGVGALLLGWIIGQSVSSKKRRYGSLLD